MSKFKASLASYRRKQAQELYGMLLLYRDDDAEMESVAKDRIAWSDLIVAATSSGISCAMIADGVRVSISEVERWKDAVKLPMGAGTGKLVCMFLLDHFIKNQ